MIEEDMRRKARELEETAKNIWNDLEKKANLFLEAALIRNKLGHRNDERFDFGNYHYALGSKFLNEGNFDDALNEFWEALICFLDLEITFMALNSLSNYMISHFRSKEDTEVYPTFSEEYFEKIESALATIEGFTEKQDLETSDIYNNVKYYYLVQKSRFLYNQPRDLSTLIDSLRLLEQAKKYS
ncbi:MAG: hypothetical protein QXO71_02650 [Candidatus Jordarchaeaceae archaeon]